MLACRGMERLPWACLGLSSPSPGAWGRPDFSSRSVSLQLTAGGGSPASKQHPMIVIMTLVRPVDSSGYRSLTKRRGSPAPTRGSGARHAESRGWRWRPARAPVDSPICREQLQAVPGAGLFSLPSGKARRGPGLLVVDGAWTPALPRRGCPRSQAFPSSGSWSRRGDVQR